MFKWAVKSTVPYVVVVVVVRFVLDTRGCVDVSLVLLESCVHQY